MFDNDRYITSGVNDTIGIQVQIAMWNRIDELKKKDKFKIDYLQIFELKCITANKSFNQEIIHKQEVEPYKKMYLLSAIKPVNAKIYVIDDGSNSVMMLAEEY